MGAGANQMEVVPVDFVDQKPVRLEMAISVVHPVARERMILVSGWEKVFLMEQQDDVAEL
jgi:hypothetical protein